MPAAPACVTCGTALHGEYCHVCGERVVTAADRRLIPFVRDALHGAFDTDSRLWRSLRLLIMRPGELTAEYLRGRRRIYLGPLQLFLLANVLFFTMISTIGGFETFTTRLRYHVEMVGYGSIAARLVERSVPADSAQRAEYERRFDETTPRYANSMVILMVPILAALLFVLYAGRKLYVHHLVFSLHLMGWLLLMLVGFALTLRVLFMTALWLVGAETATMALGWLDNEAMFSALVMLLILTHAVPALRRSYGDRLLHAIPRSLGLVVALMVALTVYRMLLFFVVYYRMGQ